MAQWVRAAAHSSLGCSSPKQLSAHAPGEAVGPGLNAWAPERMCRGIQVKLLASAGGWEDLRSRWMEAGQCVVTCSPALSHTQRGGGGQVKKGSAVIEYWCVTRRTRLSPVWPAREEHCGM